MALLAAALMLCAPLPGHYVWRLLYPITGIAHLRDYLGHLRFIAVVLCVIYSAACRLAPDDQVESLVCRADVPCRNLGTTILRGGALWIRAEGVDARIAQLMSCAGSGAFLRQQCGCGSEGLRDIHRCGLTREAQQ